jgi:hypothetical protein
MVGADIQDLPARLDHAPQPCELGLEPVFLLEQNPRRDLVQVVGRDDPHAVLYFQLDRCLRRQARIQWDRSAASGGGLHHVIPGRIGPTPTIAQPA